MASFTPRQPRQLEAECVEFRPGGSGDRAFFLAEARNAKEERTLSEIFASLAPFGDVVPLAQGPVMSYAVQLDPAVANLDLFAKVERILVSRFAFTVVEREVTDVTLRLARELCAEAGGEVADVPECDICDGRDPFPTRETVVWADGRREEEHLVFCRRCSQRAAHADPAQQARSLHEQAGRGYRLAADVPVVIIDEAAEEPSRLRRTG